MDKRDRAVIFRDRLGKAMDRAGLSRSALARETRVDRSTISQILSDEETRLPNAQLAADSAAALGVSVDWLLGLTDRPERPGDVIAAAMTVTQAQRTLADEQLLAWHREAGGYKIRHVPATLPDMLKTEAVMQWEYDAFVGRTPEQAIGAMRDRVSWLRAATSDYEIAIPKHELEAFAAGVGYYDGLSRAVRLEQLRSLQTVCEEYYPSLRLFFFDARRVFSAPVTIFGPLLAAIYVGRVYMAFREGERVKTLIAHFDWLVREAVIDARDASKFIANLAEPLQ
ncbi:MAG: helix-turn-helix transcriptional regulator [Pseudomonadota bacterium]